MKTAKSFKEGMAANQRRPGSEGHRFDTRCQQGLCTVESLLKCALLLVICTHTIKSWVSWLYICFTCEICDMSSIINRYTSCFRFAHDKPIDVCELLGTGSEHLDGVYHQYSVAWGPCTGSLGLEIEGSSSCEHHSSRLMELLTDLNLDWQSGRVTEWRVCQSCRCFLELMASHNYYLDLF